MRFPLASAAVAATLLVCPLAHAAPDPIAVEDFMRAPAVYAPQLSPKGDFIASLQPSGGRDAIVVSPVAGGPAQTIARDAQRSIDNVRWSADGRWLFYLQDSGGDEGYHLFRLKPDGTQLRDLTPFKGVTAELVALPAARPHIAVIALNRRDPAFADAFRLDLDSGTLELAAQNDGHMTGYFADGAGRVLLATAIRGDGVLDVLARRDERAPWRRIYAAPAAERFSVLQLDPKGTQAVVRSNRGSAREDLFRLSLDDGKLRRAGPHRCGGFDAGDMIADDAGRELARTCVTAYATVIPTAPVMRRALAALNAPGKTVEAVSRSRDARQWLFDVNASDDPGRYYLYDDRSRTARVLFAKRPWLDGRRLSASQFSWIAARDGRPLPVYLTMPAVAAGAKPPLLVLIHGGPWSRDTGTFSGEVQIWADRGYAVLQVEFRGSTGFGKAHVEAGVGQFGHAMIDDILDGADWAIRTQGVSDRACAMGGSYGGYATLVALTRYPERFACGIDYAGPEDLVTLVEAFRPDWKPYLPRSWYRFVGNPADPDQRRAMAEQSPIHVIDRARAPLLIFQGANDPRVTRAQSDQVARAFCERHLGLTYLVAGNEGHSFGNEETALAVTRAAEVFLGAALGGRVQPAASPAVAAALERLQVKNPCGAP